MVGMGWAAVPAPALWPSAIKVNLKLNFIFIQIRYVLLLNAISEIYYNRN